MTIELYRILMGHTNLSKDEAKALLGKIADMYGLEDTEDLGFKRDGLSFYITAFVPVDETETQTDVYKVKISKSGTILNVEI